MSLLPTRPRPAAHRYQQYATSFAVTYDTLPYIAARMQRLLSWGRSMTVCRRYLDRMTPPGHLDMRVGVLMLDEPEIREDNVRRHLAVRTNSRSVLDDFGVHAHAGAYTYLANPGESEENALFRHWHDAGPAERSWSLSLRNSTFVLLEGGNGADLPRHDDKIVIIRIGERLAEEIMICFDSHAWWNAWSARENSMLEGEDSYPARFRPCEELITDGPYRIQCRTQLNDDGTCNRAAEHTPYVPYPWKGVDL